jgi:ADP-ribose pyrophosphatase
MPKPWKTLSKKTVLDQGNFLKVEYHSMQLPDGRLIEDWHYTITPDAACILAETPDGRFLCFRQTKYALDGITLAPPTGFLEPGEDPLKAAQRELLKGDRLPG